MTFKKIYILKQSVIKQWLSACGYLLFDLAVLNPPGGEGPHGLHLFLLSVQRLAQILDHLRNDKRRAIGHRPKVKSYFYVEKQ